MTSGKTWQNPLVLSSFYYYILHNYYSRRDRPPPRPGRAGGGLHPVRPQRPPVPVRRVRDDGGCVKRPLGGLPRGDDVDVRGGSARDGGRRVEQSEAELMGGEGCLARRKLLLLGRGPPGRCKREPADPGLPAGPPSTGRPLGGYGPDSTSTVMPGPARVEGRRDPKHPRLGERGRQRGRRGARPTPWSPSS